MSGFLIFDKDKILGGDLAYEDVPKYLPVLESMRSQGQGEHADLILNKMVETGHPLALIQQAKNLIDQNKNDEASIVMEQAVKTDETDALLNYAHGFSMVRLTLKIQIMHWQCLKRLLIEDSMNSQLLHPHSL